MVAAWGLQGIACDRPDRRGPCHLLQLHLPAQHGMHKHALQAGMWPGLHSAPAAQLRGPVAHMVVVPGGLVTRVGWPVLRATKITTHHQRVVQRLPAACSARCFPGAKTLAGSVACMADRPPDVA